MLNRIITDAWRRYRSVPEEDPDAESIESINVAIVGDTNFGKSYSLSMAIVAIQNGGYGYPNGSIGSPMAKNNEMDHFHSLVSRQLDPNDWHNTTKMTHLMFTAQLAPEIWGGDPRQGKKTILFSVKDVPGEAFEIASLDQNNFKTIKVREQERLEFQNWLQQSTGVIFAVPAATASSYSSETRGGGRREILAGFEDEVKKLQAAKAGGELDDLKHVIIVFTMCDIFFMGMRDHAIDVAADSEAVKRILIGILAKKPQVWKDVLAKIIDAGLSPMIMMTSSLGFHSKLGTANVGFGDNADVPEAEADKVTDNLAQIAKRTEDNNFIPYLVADPIIYAATGIGDKNDFIFELEELVNLIADADDLWWAGSDWPHHEV